jgi:hypothetical protein
MPHVQTIDERVSAIERSVRELQDRLDAMSGKSDWLSRLHGAFADYPEFDEVIRLGQEFRRASGFPEDQETGETSE